MRKLTNNFPFELSVETAPRRPGRPRAVNALSGAQRVQLYRQRQLNAGVHRREVNRASNAVPAARAGAPSVPRQLADMESLALHAVLAAELLRTGRPLHGVRDLLEAPRHNRRGITVATAWLRHWRPLLDEPIEKLAQVLVDTGPRATWLRRHSPFALVATAHQVRHVRLAFAPLSQILAWAR